MRNYLIIIVSSIVMFNCGKDQSSQMEDKTPPIPVNITKVSANGHSPFISASGKIQAANSATLSTRMMGFVEKVHVTVGDEVRKGQLLISISSADLQAKKAQVDASITEASAAFNIAKKDYQRFNNLFAEQSASQKELDDITARFEMAKARLEAARQMKNEVSAQFAYANISAPFNGIITGKYVKTGDMANPGQPLVAIEGQEGFEVIAMVPETEISNIKHGIEVDVFINSIDQTITGQIIEVSPSANQTGGQYLVKVNLTEAPDDILSGMFATVQFPVEKQSDDQKKVLIPTDVLVHQGQLSGVYTVSQNNTALLRWLRLGREFGDQVEVLSGLRADETYISSSEAKLYNGARVSIK